MLLGSSVLESECACKFTVLARTIESIELLDRDVANRTQYSPDYFAVYLRLY